MTPKELNHRSPARQAAAGPRGPVAIRLARLLEAYAPHDGSFDLRIRGLHAIRRSQINTELIHGVQQTSLCLVAQGAKTIMVGPEAYEYDASRMIVFSVDLPVAAQVTRASYAEPFLCFKLDLEPQDIARLVLKVYPRGLPRTQDKGAVTLGQADAKIFNAAVRLVELMAQPEDAELLAPLIVDEILIRLLRSPIGVQVAQIGLADSGLNGVARAVSWLKDNFAEPMKVEELARLAHMSVSTFHQHFKSATSMSPLQFQKVLRLQEARRLMLSSMMDAGVACGQVGHVSASQFSREYGRFFGSAPTRDISRLRGQLVQVADG